MWTLKIFKTVSTISILFILASFYIFKQKQGFQTNSVTSYSRILSAADSNSIDDNDANSPYMTLPKHLDDTTQFETANDVANFFTPNFPLRREPFYWVLTAPQHTERCREILDSWGKPPRVAENLYFYGAARNYTDPSGATFVNVMPDSEFKEGTLDSIVEREIVSLADMYEKYGAKHDWFVKADDDTFYIVDNLLPYLETLDPEQPWLLGFKMHRIVEFEHVHALEFPRVHGGAGYILSRPALKKLYDYAEKCRKIFRNLHGDTVVSGCLATAGIIAEDTRDISGKFRFNMDNTKRHTRALSPTHWRCTATWGEVTDGDKCCPEDTTISFHYMIGKMRGFEWPLK